MTSDSEPGFSAVARDHAMYPRHLGPPQRWDGRARTTGPCGDTMEFWVTVEDGCVKRVWFTTDGCGSSLACGSFATQLQRDVLQFQDAPRDSDRSERVRLVVGTPTRRARHELRAHAMRRTIRGVVAAGAIGLSLLRPEPAEHPARADSD